MKLMTPEEYRALLRSDLYSFAQRCFHELKPTEEFSGNWHIELGAAKLHDCMNGKITRLIINQPPRSLKSILVSVAFPAFILGHNPSAEIICISYGQDLADKPARDCRRIMTTDWYQELFPGTRLSPERSAVAEFTTTKQGFRLSTSVGGPLTGRGADYMIFDDPLKPDEAISDTVRRAANEWFNNTAYSRLNDKLRGRIIFVMQRLHQDDLAGHLLQQGVGLWDHLCLPAIAERDEEYLIETPVRCYRFTRKAGEALHPSYESLAALDDIRRTIGEYNFAGQYQQAPAPFGGGLVKIAWLKTYQPHELPTDFDRVIQSWDTANKPSDLSDYSVCTTWGLKGRLIYLLNVYRKRVDYPTLKRDVRELAAAFRASVVLIEDRASGTQLIQELRNEGFYAAQAYKPKDDKRMRMYAQTAMMENGLVLLPTEAYWLAEYIAELTTFPNGKYDDQVDSTSQALDWIKQGASEPYLLQYMRLEAEKLRNPPVQMVRLRVPFGTTALQLRTRIVYVPNDGIVELTTEEAKPLLRIGFTKVDDAV